MKKLLLSILLLATIGILYAGTAHPVYVELVDQSGQHPDTATFNAWIVGREGEVLTETSGGCTYYGSGSYKGSAVIQCGTFPTQWNGGDVLHVEATTPLGNGSGEFTLNTANYQFFGDMYGTWSEGPGITLIPANNLNFGNGVTGNIDHGTPSNPGTDGAVDHQAELAFPANAGYYFTLTIDDTTFPVDITITLDTATLGYDPYDFAYYYNGVWNYISPLAWTNPGTDHASFTFTLGAKGAKADVNIPMVFANGPNQPNTLPVVLAQFNVKQLAQFAQITWTTQSETNMIGYKIWRATVENLDKAQAVSSLINATNETTGHSYSYTDKNVADNSTYYYWLEAQNYDGSNHYYELGDVTIEPNNTPTLPQVTALKQNYPNPFNPETTINFSVKEGETGTLTIYNQKGQVVVRKAFSAGNYEYTWDGTRYASGIYFYKLQTPSYSKINKMIMLK